MEKDRLIEILESLQEKTGYHSRKGQEAYDNKNSVAHWYHHGIVEGVSMAIQMLEEELIREWGDDLLGWNEEDD